MEILAYQKKKVSWRVSFNDLGEIETGRTYGRNILDKIPIFRAKLKYHGHYQGTKSVMIQFRASDEDAFFAALKGTKCIYDMDRDNGMNTMEHLILQDNPEYEYHGDGWFTGVFTFEKRGRRVFIKPYTGDISKELPAT